MLILSDRASAINLPDGWEFQSPSSDEWVPFTPIYNEKILHAASTGNITPSTCIFK